MILSPLWAPFVALELLAPGSAYIETLSVIEIMPGQGSETQRLAFAQRFLGSKGMSVIVGSHDQALGRFFEDNGFSEATCRPMVTNNWHTPGTEWILLRKP